MFKAAAGIQLQHVPYRGSAPALTDLLAGQITLMFDPLQSVLSNVLGGKIRALAISSKARSPVLSSVPTIAESGYPDFEATARWAVLAPAGLPADATAALSDATAKIARSDEFKRQARAARSRADGHERRRLRRVQEGRAREVGQGGARFRREHGLSGDDRE